MNNRTISIARTFLTDHSYYRYQAMKDLDLRTLAEPFMTEKPAQGIVPLPTRLMPALGSVDELQESVVPERTVEMRLATLLHYTLGLVRYEEGGARPFHRVTPSPRCLYASELFVCPLTDAWIGEVGAYRYHPLQHGL